MIKHISKTERNPSSFDPGTLNSQQRKLHEGIVDCWHSICVHQVSLGRQLLEMHETFSNRGVVKRGGPGSRWTRYLAFVGIPKSTAKDYMDLAKKRDEAGVPKKAEEQLARVGIALDKPKVVDAMLAPELRKKVASIKNAKDAEVVKARIMEMMRQPQRASEVDKPLGEEAADAIAKGEALSKTIGYLDRFSGKVFRFKFAEFWRDL